MISPRTLLGRYGLLASTLSMGLALVATGAAGYSAARKAAASLIQARSIDVTLLVRRELHLVDALDGESLRGVVEELADQQVTYLAVLDHGQVVASCGAPAAAQGGPFSSAGGIRWQRVSGHVRVVTGIGHPWHNRLAGNFHMGARSGLSFVVEFLPGPAQELTSGALATLVVSCFGAALLLAAAIFSWRRTREAELLTVQLARDQELKSLGQMSAVLSHELRNPLTALKGHTQLLLEKLDPGHPGRPGAMRVLSSALRLEAIANQILDFAKPGAGTLTPSDPRAVAEAAVELAGEARVQVTAASSIPPWPLDRLRMEQVLVNLIRNAAQAAPEGPIELGITLESGWLVFSVRDHGPGLPPGEEARIFEPFHGKNLKGTGLGLAICRQIVEAHGGRIEGATHPGGGALFRVLLPEKRP